MIPRQSPTLPVALILAACCAFYPALGLPRLARLAVLAILGSAVVLAPLLIEPGLSLARLLVAIFAAAEAIKLLDLHLGIDRGHRPDLRAFLGFMINPTSVVQRKLGEGRRPGRGADLGRLGLSLAGAVGGALLVAMAFRVDWLSRPFAVEHGSKVISFFLALIPFFAVVTSSWRLVGGRGRDFMDNPFVARTPADFWRRYNRPAQEFFREDVFKPLGGPRRPLRVALATFLVSALLHEYAFDVGAGRIQGYQSAFFLIQGVGVVATMRVRPLGWRRYPWIAATLAFNLVTGVLFFASLDEVVPFYATRPGVAASSLAR